MSYRLKHWKSKNFLSAVLLLLALCPQIVTADPTDASSSERAEQAQVQKPADSPPSVPPPERGELNGTNAQTTKRLGLQAFHDEFRSAITNAILEKGTGQMARVVRKFSERAQKEITFDEVREFVLEGNGGQPMEILIPEYESSINAVNRRLQRAGVDFYIYKQLPGVKLPKAEDPIPEHARLSKKWKTIRTGLSLIVGPGGFIVGGVMSGRPIAGLFASVVSLGLEIWFITKSGWWNEKVWKPYGFKGNIGANLMYAGLTLGADMVGARVSHEAMEFDVKSAKDWEKYGIGTAFNTATFVATFGAGQVALATLKSDGEFTEFPRFFGETAMAGPAIFGRGAAIAATVLMPVNQAGKVDWGIWEPLNARNWTLGQKIGYGVEGLIGFFVAAPLWTKILWGNAAYDRITNYKFAKQGGKSHELDSRPLTRWRLGCLAKVADVFTATKTSFVRTASWSPF